MDLIDFTKYSYAIGRNQCMILKMCLVFPFAMVVAEFKWHGILLFSPT